ncbi:hypothetical protein pv_247 [Pithovirus sibericum]|uniref:F-box domain-containing protein n=1 Tax=Pithovirus sibericum TaxID=1450746 RepID=W5S573_9VIRU|nr:hypothetical protein pv_247 [Pithovirus sibericum]AHH01814.1 hypothetical protein pv_247 [Pithovirus sibericum]
MESFFDILPDEVNLQILNRLTHPSDLLKASRSDSLSHYFDWNFWKKEAFQLWEVPEWYFDLPIQQKREIDGRGRFVEVATQFEIITESLVGIKDGKVDEGVYFEDDDNFVSRIYWDSQEAGTLDLKTDKDLKNSPVFRFGLSTAIYLELLGSVKGGRNFLRDINLIMSCVRNEEIEGVREKFLFEKPFRTAVGLAILGNEKLYDWVDCVFKSLKSDGHLAVICFSMLSDNFRLFEELHSRSDLSDGDKRALLRKAYYLARKPHISFLEKLGIQIDFVDKISQLDSGFTDVNRPVQFYSILQRLLSDETHYQQEIKTRNLKDQPDFFLLLNDHLSPEDLFSEMRSALRSNTVTVGLFRHCALILKENDELQDSFPYILCEVQQAIFQELEIDIPIIRKSDVVSFGSDMELSYFLENSA